MIPKSCLKGKCVMDIDLPNPVQRRGQQKEVGTRKVSESRSHVHTHYESWDYDVCESEILKDDEDSKGYHFIAKKHFFRWSIMVIVGAATGIFACAVDIAIDKGTTLKFSILQKQMTEYTIRGFFMVPFLYWLLTNAFLVFLASSLATYVEPVAAGSGIPQLMIYLNGVKVPKLFRLKTMLVRVSSIILSVIGGLIVGKEPPMSCAGAVFAAGISQGMMPSIEKDFGFFKYFRDDREKRDFVSAGAAAGVASAFGSPLGGVIFSLEQASSFWNQTLTWRMFLGSMVTVFVMSVVVSLYHGNLWNVMFMGLPHLGKFENIYYTLAEIPIFVLMGIVGGVLGAIYSFIYQKTTEFKSKHLSKRWMKVAEAVFVAVLTPCVGMLMLYTVDDCNPMTSDRPELTIRMFCPEGQYSAVSSFWFQSPGAKVHSMLHEPKDEHDWTSLLIFATFYFLLSCWTIGLSTGSGIYMPCLLVGGAWGRALGILVDDYILPVGSVKKYALMGCAAQLGGIIRMPVFLTVTLIETTGNLGLGLPIMMTINMAKIVGDYFNEGFFDTYIRLSGTPILPWDPPPLSRNISAKQVMAAPVVTFSLVENVGRISDILRTTKHAGFPVIDERGRFHGLMLRDYLLVMLKNKLYKETEIYWDNDEVFNLDLFMDPYPHYPKLEDIKLSVEERGCSFDLRPVMNLSPYFVRDTATLPRIFKLFRGLGLRHLVVVDHDNMVVGMVTRKDLSRFRIKKRMGSLQLKKFSIVDI